MTDFTINLVDAIISGRATDIETTFQEAITDKISIAMEARKTELAQSIFTEANQHNRKESVDLDEASDRKFINVATSRAHIERAEKALKDSPNMWSGPKAGYKSLITVHKKHLLNNEELEELEDYMMSEDFEQLDKEDQEILFELTQGLKDRYIEEANSDTDSRLDDLSVEKAVDKLTK